MADFNTSTAVPDGEWNTFPPSCAISRKRAKTDAARSELPRGRQRMTGRLSEFMNMPMDILMEIFGHLHPLDLLHLARTTKAFRQVLMHRTSISAWKAARSNVFGFPDCPPEMSEPQWAYLAFDPRCNVCCRPNIRNVDWMLRIRICLECTKTHIMESRADYRYVFQFDNLWDAVPFRLGRRRRREVLKHEYDSVKAQYLAIQDANARVAFITERVKLVNSRRAHADLCQEWADTQALDRSDEIGRLRTSRYESIVERLTTLGWGDEISALPFNSLSNHKLVKTPQLLTERIWGNIRKPLIGYMEDMKTKRLARELASLKGKLEIRAVSLLQAHKTLCAPFSGVMPEPLDLFAFEPIKELLDNANDDTEEQLVDLTPDFGVMIEKWREEITAEFLKGVKSSVNIMEIFVELDHTAPGENETELGNIEAPDYYNRQHLKLACTVYRCISCCRRPLTTWANSSSITHPFSTSPWFSRAPVCNPLWFPRVLGHRCLMKLSGFDLLTVKYPALRHLCRKKWSCESIEIDDKASEIAETVIRACGMDPLSAHASDMDDLDARLECLACLDPIEGSTSHHVFGWRSAVKHQREVHPSELGSWRQLTSYEANEALLEEHLLALTLPKEIVPSNQKVLLCLHCLDLPSEVSWMTLEDTEKHIRECHNIDSPAMNHDYVKDFAAPEIYATKTLPNASIVKFPDPEWPLLRYL